MNYLIVDQIQRMILMPYFVMALNQKIWDANNEFYRNMMTGNNGK